MNTRIKHEADIVIVGATPGGIAAAVSAAERGRSVLLLERSAHIGGLPANGLGATDIATRGATGGFFTHFTESIKAHYAKHYGADSQQVHDCDGGIFFEASVAEKVLLAILAAQPRIRVLLHRQFDAEPDNVEKTGARLTGIEILDLTSGETEAVRGRVFIDATYEGDLADAAGAPCRLGREDQREFNEPMAGRIYKPWCGEIAAGTTGRGDNAVQSYNYRLPLTMDPTRRVPFARPASYRREDYISIIDDIRLNRNTGAAGTIPNELHWDGIGRIVNIVELPNNKTDSNNQHRAFVSTDLPEENWPWPSAGWEWRDRYAQRLRDYTLGLLWFCQNDPELPEDFRQRCAPWGLAADEYQDNGNFPRQVYVREGRRIVGEHIFTAHDALPTVPGGRPPVHADSITGSHYALDSHATRKRETGRLHLEGFFSHKSAPYTVPYRVITPLEVEGLLVPVAASATHVGFSTLRMEPCWMALGEAAGVAAAMSLETGTPVRKIPIGALQRALLKRGAVLLYFKDVPIGHPAAPAFQLLGLQGVITGWHARPDDSITAEEAREWTRILGIPGIEPRVGTQTRADFLAEAWTASAGARPVLLAT
ncbi:MAG: dependent oxidoreductase [Rariglobus sp.]|jgi:hypothetical protein|nr:dependent oxidoreductase [Rariglobus sp.]